MTYVLRTCFLQFFFLVLLRHACADSVENNGGGYLRHDGNNSNQQVDTFQHIHRRLSSSDPKTVESKGYVCAKGAVPWDDRETMLSELPSFLKAYEERNEVFRGSIGKWGAPNSRGNGFFHSFLIWVVLRQLKPLVVVESGVGDGYTSWLIAKATEEWAPVFVRVDPTNRGWNGEYSNPNADKQVDVRGLSFTDIAEIDWNGLLKRYELPNNYREQTLVILDDHQDQLRRLIELVKLGISNVILDDNYMPGVGPQFSIKDACDGPGRLRHAFSPNGEDFVPKRCDNLRSNCEKIEFGEATWKRYALQLEIIVDTYWEGPPLTPLEEPYGSILQFIEKRLYEGPLKWTQGHSQLVSDSTKEPIFKSLKEASKATGLPESTLSMESGRYFHLAYVKLRTSAPSRE